MKRPSLSLALAATALAANLAHAQNVWQPNANNGAQVWSNPAQWSAGVPGPASDVQIPAGAPTLDVNAQIGSLTIQNNGGVRGTKNLTVTGSTSLQNIAVHATSIDAETGGVFSLGTLTNFSNGILSGNYTCNHSAAQFAPTTVQFRGANVTELDGEIYLFGSGALMRDQDSGLNAFRNLAVVRPNALFYLEDAPPHTTSGNLTNRGDFLIYDSLNATATTYTINGSLTNTDNGYLEAYGNSQITVKGNLLNATTGPQGEIYVSNNGAVPTGEAILSVDGDVTNQMGSEITVEGYGERRARLIVKGAMTNNGEMTLIGSGSLEVAGVLTVAPDSILNLIGTNATETFTMTAKRIDAAAGSAFGARGTIFADLVEHGVFYPGASPGRVTINGSVAFGSTASLQFEIGGVTPGTNYDQVVQQSTGTGGVTLGGNLALILVNDFENTIQSSNTFTILSSNLPLSGSFSNVANGGRLRTVNGSSSFQVNYSGNNVVLSNFAPEPFMLDNAYSQKFHGDQAFQIPLPLNGPAGVECRRTAVNGEHQIVFIFTNSLTSAEAAVTSGIGSVANASITANALVVNLSGVGNAQTLTITLSNLSDTLNQTLPPTSVSMRVLLGDSSGDATVNSGDTQQTRSRSGQLASPTNFRSDVNSDGAINTGDAAVVRSRSGTTVP